MHTLPKKIQFTETDKKGKSRTVTYEDLKLLVDEQGWRISYREKINK